MVLEGGRQVSGLEVLVLGNLGQVALRNVIRNKGIRKSVSSQQASAIELRFMGRFPSSGRRKEKNGKQEAGPPPQRDQAEFQARSQTWNTGPD